jgi:hypothetical protein
MVTEGNHEVEFSPVVSPTRFTAFNARWQMPYKESKSTSNLYYSFQVAGTHIIMLGSYAEFDTDSEQYAWLVADLAKIDRKRTPWVVVVLHAPWYNTNIAHQGEGESMRIAMEELLYKARVDLVYSGHVHAYERFVSQILIPSWQILINSHNSCIILPEKCCLMNYVFNTSTILLDFALLLYAD